MGRERPDAASVNPLGGQDPGFRFRAIANVNRAGHFHADITCRHHSGGNAATVETRHDRIAIGLIRKRGNERSSVNPASQSAGSKNLLDASNNRTVRHFRVDQLGARRPSRTEYAKHSNGCRLSLTAGGRLDRETPGLKRRINLLEGSVSEWRMPTQDEPLEQFRQCHRCLLARKRWSTLRPFCYWYLTPFPTITQLICGNALAKASKCEA